MKLVTVVGARPQFIKAAAVSRVLRNEHQEILIHTGQHYDKNMSDLFFEELSIPKPDYHLNAGSGTHARQTASMLVGIEDILTRENPDCLMVYGDTNSTLAGALAASKLLIPIIHVEAGLRSFNMRMPEEQNRVLTDHISTLLFCPTQTSVDCLKKEGITEGVHQVGDVMCDAVLYYSARMNRQGKDAYLGRLEGLFGPVPSVDAWYLATIHRAENTDSPEKVEKVLSAFEQLDAPVIFSVHPRTKGIVRQLCQAYAYRNILFVDPMGYLDMLYFTKNAKKVITDSGGLQKEAYILDTPCVTVREQTEWIETLVGNHNVLTTPEPEDILEHVLHTVVDPSPKVDYYGTGHAAQQICAILKQVEGKK